MRKMGREKNLDLVQKTLDFFRKTLDLFSTRRRIVFQSRFFRFQGAHIDFIFIFHFFVKKADISTKSFVYVKYFQFFCKLK